MTNTDKDKNLAEAKRIMGRLVTTPPQAAQSVEAQRKGQKESRAARRSAPRALEALEQGDD
jgi:hypothetical protein